MILKPFVVNSLVTLCLKIVNSAVVIGLYYGFLSTFSVGPSYLFLIRAQIMEEGAETKISATTGFITGQLMMFISIYYAPFHLALNRPHTITVLTLSYLFFNFLYKNDKYYYSDPGSDLDWGYKNQNSIRKITIYKVFLNNLFFQLLNPLLFPSSILIRLMNIYLFRSNNKLLFLTSSFVGWLIGHIFLMKCIGLILVWLQQKNSIKSKITMRFDKYILLQLRNYVGQIFVVFSFVILAHYLGRIPLPYFYIDEMLEHDEKEKDQIKDEINEIDVEIDSETEETKQEQNGSIKEYYLRSYLFPEKDKILDNIEDEDKDENNLFFEKPLVTTLFDYQKWNRPLRYIKNDHFERVVRDENSQLFFHICQSDGKQRISFTYPPNLSTFLKIMEQKLGYFIRAKTSYNDNELSNYWIRTITIKRKKQSNEFFQRAKVLDKKYNKFLPEDIFENRIRLSKDKRKKKYLPKIYDPFLSGRFRGQSKKSFSPLMKKETYTTNNILINKIHGLLLSFNSTCGDPELEAKIDQFGRNVLLKFPELEPKMDQVTRKYLLNDIGFFVNLMSKFSEKSVSSLNFEGLYLFSEHEQVKIYSEKKKKNYYSTQLELIVTIFQFLIERDVVKINEIGKQVPRWSYTLIDDVEQLAQGIVKDAQIRSATAERIVVFNAKTDSLNFLPRNRDIDIDNIDKTNDKEDTPEAKRSQELALITLSPEPDYNREIIRGSMRPQRRKTVTSKLFQGNAHSPIFLEVIDNNPLFELFEDIFVSLKEYFRKPGTDNSEFLDFAKRIEEKEKAENLDEDERRLKEIEENWENVLYGLIIRSFVLLIQSIIRRYILIPSLIITKNIIRILLFQNPEWSEDFRDWRKEVHIKCTYQGVPVSQNELPKNWFNDGIQIRVLCPFVLKPWHNSKVRSTEKKKDPLKKKKKQKNFWFLTAYGTLVESYLDDHVPIPFLFLGPVFKKIKKQLKKDLKNRFFLVQKVLNERKKWFRTLLKKIDKLSESKKISTISKNNPIIEESPVIIQSINWTNSSFTDTEKRIKDLNVKTKTIIKQIEKMTEKKKEGIITSEINLNLNKTTYDAKRLELQKNILQILERRNVRLIRKSYSFFKFFIERVYIDILLYIISISRIHRQRFLDFLESTNKIVNVDKSISKKKNEERIYKTNQSIIPFMSIIDKSWNITNMKSQNSCDVSSLSQAYVFFKLSQIQVRNGYKYKLRSIFESHGRSFFLKNEIKDYFFKIQGIFNSKLRQKNRPDSLMNQWTNWLKVHYQYDLPQSRWSRLGARNWRNRINEHWAENKDLVEYDSYDKTQLILYKKKQVDFLVLEIKKKINKQYRYDLFSYQYINYADKKKSYIYGYRSPFQANKNRAISYNYNIRKGELFDIMGDISIQNYIAEDNIINMEKNLNRKYFNWMGINVERKKNSIRNPKSEITEYELAKPRFWFFSKLRILYDAYKKNPWILPIEFFFLQFSGNENITDESKLEAKQYVSGVDLKSSGSKYFHGSDVGYYINKYRNDLKGERDFLLEKYLGFGLHCESFVQESIMNNFNLFCLLVRLKNIKKFFIMSIKKGDLDMEDMMYLTSKDFRSYKGCRDTEDLRDNLMFFIEPIRLSIKNYEPFFIYQTTSLSLIHKSKREIWKRNPEKGRVDQKITENKYKNHYDLLVPENLLSTRRRRELRILICFNSKNRNTVVHRNTKNHNENKINNSCQVLAKNKDLDSETKKLMNLKFFLWPNYRLEDLACINRYWFDTHNGSHFSILRIHMYPRLQI
uniref:Hypothetical chloroplast RF19 n=1 Tax=Trifolium grandiflorum TaxID=97024 RepID=A0A023HPR0_9FABA|nr:hypothetical chloroplast RF19 [Trifolium grandiflorum]AGO63732.1 hypothetical chloroplast RF19 [Trifolium grandiflorum]